MTNLLLTLTLAFLTIAGQQETRPVPKDSMLVENVDKMRLRDPSDEAHA